MIALHPQFINDNDGKKTMVILPVKEFEDIIEALDDLEDVKLYDKAKKEDNGARILFSDYLKNRKQKNG